MGALADLWKSERGLVAIALIAAVTVLAGLQQVTVEQWMEYSKWIFLTYAAAKTVTGAVSMATDRPDSTAGLTALAAAVAEIYARRPTEPAATAATSPEVHPDQSPPKEPA